MILIFSTNHDYSTQVVIDWLDFLKHRIILKQGYSSAIE